MEIKRNYETPSVMCIGFSYDTMLATSPAGLGGSLGNLGKIDDYEEME